MENKSPFDCVHKEREVFQDMDDGTEYTYNTTQIFCYDRNDVDDATGELISSQITRAMEICKDEEAKNPNEVSST